MGYTRPGTNTAFPFQHPVLGLGKQVALKHEMHEAQAQSQLSLRQIHPCVQELACSTC